MSYDLAPASTGELTTMELGKMLAQSGYFQDATQAAQAVVKVLAGRELGLGPIASMTGIYIVKGRVTLSANLIAAAIKRSHRYDYRVRHMDDKGCEIEFFQGQTSLGVSTFTEVEAKAAGLAGGDNWRKFPRNMYFARAISNGAKWFCPDIFAGAVYTPDEMGATVSPEGDVIDVGPATPVRESRPEPPAPMRYDRERLAAGIKDLWRQERELGGTNPDDELNLDLATLSEEQLIVLGRSIRPRVEALTAPVEAELADVAA
jgi:hypothetical protein